MRKTSLELLIGKPSATKCFRSLRLNAPSKLYVLPLFCLEWGWAQFCACLRCGFHKKSHPISARHGVNFVGVANRNLADRGQPQGSQFSTKRKVHCLGWWSMLPNACMDPTQLQEPTAQTVEFSAKQCQNVASGRLMFESEKALGRNPLNILNSRSFCGAWGRSNIDWVQRGAFKRDSIRDFALRLPWHRRALMAIVWKIWLSLPKGKVAVDYSLQASLTFGNRRWHIWSSPICCRCIRHRNYAFVAAFTKSRRGNSKTFSQAVPKRCQWKIDVWIRESFRRQNGYKIAVMLGRNPLNILNSMSFCGAWGRSNIDWVQRGAFKRDSIRDFALRLPWHRRALMAIVWKIWLSLPKEK